MTATSREAIRELMYAYCRAQDGGDFEAFGRLFAHGDFQATGGSSWRGEELAARRRANIRLRADGTPGARTLTTNIMIHVDEAAGTAQARSYFVMLRQDDGALLRPIGAGRYYDRFERVDAAWRFAHRRAVLDLQSGLESLRREVPGDTAAAWRGPPAAELPWMPQPPDSRAAIETLMYTYAERADLADFGAFSKLFAHGSFRGRTLVARGDDVGRGMAARLRVYEDGTLRTKHVTTNVRIELDEAGGFATARSYVVVFQQTDELPLSPILYGGYYDRFERAHGQWRFADRELSLIGRGDSRYHVNQPAETVEASR